MPEQGAAGECSPPQGDEANVKRLEEGLEGLVLDLDSSASIEAAVEIIKERTGGRLRALFNNGAYGQPGEVEDLSREALPQQLETNLHGTHEFPPGCCL